MKFWIIFRWPERNLDYTRHYRTILFSFLFSFGNWNRNVKRGFKFLFFCLFLWFSTSNWRVRIILTWYFLVEIYTAKGKCYNLTLSPCTRWLGCCHDNALWLTCQSNGWTCQHAWCELSSLWRIGKRFANSIFHFPCQWWCWLH